MTATHAPDTNRTRTQIAFAVIGLGAVGVVALGVVALVFAKDKDRTAQLVFSSILPLLGTWVGAVLAFYFSRDNLQAASATTLDAVRAAGGLTADTMASTLMIRLSDIAPLAVVADETAGRQLRLLDLADQMRAAGQSRMPVLTSSNTALYVVHAADVDRFTVAAGSLDPSGTLEQLLIDPVIGSRLTSFVTVPPDSTVGQVRMRLQQVRDARDVFVTQDGQPSGTVLGWLTSTDLARTT